MRTRQEIESLRQVAADMEDRIEGLTLLGNLVLEVVLDCRERLEKGPRAAPAEASESWHAGDKM